MRLWTVHPKYLDTRGLVALWREALLAQRVLQGKTRGYTHHPQLARFRQQPDPLNCIAAYLTGIHIESINRNYKFNRDKIGPIKGVSSISETIGQLNYEWQHLLNKLQNRSPELYVEYSGIQKPEPHPLFQIVAGSIREWERIPNEYYYPGT